MDELEACYSFVENEIETVMQKYGYDYNLIFPDASPPCFAINVSDDSFNPDIIKQQLEKVVTMIPSESKKMYKFTLHPENITLGELFLMDDIDADVDVSKDEDAIEQETLVNESRNPKLEPLPKPATNTQKHSFFYKFTWMWIFIPIFLAWYWYHFVKISFQNYSLHVQVHP